MVMNWIMSISFNMPFDRYCLLPAALRTYVNIIIQPSALMTLRTALLLVRTRHIHLKTSVKKEQRQRATNRHCSYLKELFLYLLFAGQG